MAITKEQYLEAAINLLPIGFAWNKNNDSDLAKILMTYSTGLAEVNKYAHQLIRERMPGNAVSLLKDWESYFGLPECGRSINKSFSARQQQVKDKENEVGSNCHVFLEDIANKAGYEIRVINHYPHHCLRGCTYPLYEQANHWRIFIYVQQPTLLRQATCLDDVLTELTVIERYKELECLLKRYEYAHLEMVFIYKKKEEVTNVSFR